MVPSLTMRGKSTSFELADHRLLQVIDGTLTP
jgi:hypothetical protein